MLTCCNYALRCRHCPPSGSTPLAPQNSTSIPTAMTPPTSTAHRPSLGHVTRHMTSSGVLSPPLPRLRTAHAPRGVPEGLARTWSVACVRCLCPSTSGRSISTEPRTSARSGRSTRSCPADSRESRRGVVWDVRRGRRAGRVSNTTVTAGRRRAGRVDSQRQRGRVVRGVTSGEIPWLEEKLEK